MSSSFQPYPRPYPQSNDNITAQSLFGLYHCQRANQALRIHALPMALGVGSLMLAYVSYITWDGDMLCSSLLTLGGLGAKYNLAAQSRCLGCITVRRPNLALRFHALPMALGVGSLMLAYVSYIAWDGDRLCSSLLTLGGLGAKYNLAAQSRCLGCITVRRPNLALRFHALPMALGVGSLMLAYVAYVSWDGGRLCSSLLTLGGLGATCCLAAKSRSFCFSPGRNRISLRFHVWSMAWSVCVVFRTTCLMKGFWGPLQVSGSEGSR